MRPTRALAVAVLSAVLLLSACSTSGEDMDTGGTSVAAEDGDAAVGAAPDERGVAEDAALETDPDAGDPPAMERAIISKGNVQLESDDVEEAVFDVQALVDEYGGEVTDRETNTDDEGDVRMARLVLRIPAKQFSDAFGELEQVADLTSSSSTSEDVTTKVIDNAVRIRAQRRSLRRIEVLLDRAVSIRDIVNIESQLTRRQADLDSLEQQQAFLRDQTSMSTVTVNIQLTPDEPAEKKKDEDDAGFLSGLETGFKALVVFAVGLATVFGALLPWLVVLLLVGGPLWLLVRRLRRREPEPEPAGDFEAG
ncbi:MAG: DUF4349 domain-containing protein [Nocardioides sp.]